MHHLSLSFMIESIFFLKFFDIKLDAKYHQILVLVLHGNNLIDNNVYKIILK
jgi:hypothetical protein